MAITEPVPDNKDTSVDDNDTEESKGKGKKQKKYTKKKSSTMTREEQIESKCHLIQKASSDSAMPLI